MDSGPRDRRVLNEAFFLSDVYRASTSPVEGKYRVGHSPTWKKKIELPPIN